VGSVLDLTHPTLGAVSERLEQATCPSDVHEHLVDPAHVQARQREPRLEPPGLLVQQA
jgi:hypothetical protein